MRRITFDVHNFLTISTTVHLVNSILQTIAPIEPQLSKSKVQLKLAHFSRLSTSPKRLALWHKENIVAFLQNFADKHSTTLTQEQIDSVRNSFDFDEYTVLMSDMIQELGIVHNAYLTAQAEYDRAGFGPLRVNDNVRYFSVTDELKELIETHDFMYVDTLETDDVDDKLYDTQIQLKLKYLSFGMDN